MGIAIKLISTGLVSAAQISRETVVERLRESDVSENLDGVETEFNKTFERTLHNVGQSLDNQELQAIAIEWTRLVDDIEITAETTDEAITEIRDTICSHEDTQLRRTSEAALDEAIATAYEDALTEFRQQIADTQVGEELQLKIGSTLLEEISALSDEIEDIKADRTAYRPYHFLPPSDAIPIIERALIDNSDIEYIDRSEISPGPTDSKFIITGPPGSGKTTVLRHFVSNHQSDVNHIFYPKDGLAFPEDAKGIALEEISGDVLLVWDDIGRINESGDNQVFEAVYKRLQTLVRENGNQLYALLTARSGNLGSIPGDLNNKQGIWDEFTHCRLSDWRGAELTELIEQLSKSHDVSLTPPAEDFLKHRAEGPSAGILLDAIFSSNQGNTLVEEDLTSLPDGIKPVWQHQLSAIRTDHKTAMIVLEAAKLLYDLHIIRYGRLIDGLFQSVFDRNKREFRPAVRELQDRGWVQVDADSDDPTTTEAVFRIHDTLMESIDQDISRFQDEFSQFLMEQMDEYLPDVYYQNETRQKAELHASFALGLYLAEGSLDLVKKHYETALSIEPDHPAVLNNYAMFLSRTGQGNPIDRLQEAMNAADDSPNPYYNYGRMQLRRGNPQEAIQWFEKAIAIDNEFGRAHTNIGIVKYEQYRDSPKENQDQQQLDEAIEHLKDGVKYNRNPANALNSLGNILRKTGNRKEAIGIFKRAIVADPYLEMAYTNYSNTLWDIGESKKAIQVLYKGIQQNPDSHLIHGQYGARAAKMGEHDIAVKHLKRATDLKEDFGLAHQNLASVYHNQGEYDKSIFHRKLAQKYISRGIPADGSRPVVSFA